MNFQIILSQLLNLLLPLLTKYGIVKPKPQEQNWFNEDETYPEKSSLDYEPDLIIDIIKIEKKLIKFSNPVSMDIPFVTSDYGYRVLGHKKARRSFHYGCDFRARHNTLAYAVEDCIITQIVKVSRHVPCRFKYNSKTRKWKDLKNGSVTPRVVYQGKHTGNKYYHKHTKPSLKLRIGDTLMSGDQIGTYGNYGYSQGSHCHFEVWVYLDKIFGLIKKKNPTHALVNPRVWLEKISKIPCTGRKRQVSYELDME